MEDYIDDHELGRFVVYLSCEIPQITLTIYPEQIHINVRGSRSTRCTSSLQGSPVTTATDDADANVPNKGVSRVMQEKTRQEKSVHAVRRVQSSPIPLQY